MTYVRLDRLALLLAGGALLGLLAGPANAHGGQFRGPGGPPAGPGLGPLPVPTAITPGDTWQTWWDLNRLGLIPGRDVALRRQVLTPGEADAESLEEGWAKRRLIAARQTVVPYLLGLVAPERDTRDEVRAAALIALGKVSEASAVYPVFGRWLKDPKASEIVQESAALGIGLLRRTRPSLQAEGSALDELRATLLETVADREARIRVRAFAALGVGLLGDQPFGSSVTKDGRLVVRALWSQLAEVPKGDDLPIAVLVALGMQPPEGVPDAVREALRQIVLGRSVHDRRWTALERSHALTAVLRLGGPGAYGMLLRVLRRHREDEELKRAAYLALGRMAAALTDEERGEVAAVLEEALSRRRDPLTTGLGYVAAGRLLGRDLADGEITVLDASNLARLLVESARKGTSAERGWAALGLGIAGRGAKDSGLARPLYEKVKQILLDGLITGRGDDRLRAAYAAALGILDVPEAVAPLLGVVRDTHADPVLRGHAAVALGQMGRSPKEVRPTLLELLAEKRGVLLRVRAAMALALLGGTLTRTQLARELEEATSEYHRAHVVIALGRLGDLQAIPDLLAYARDEGQSELARALAVVALGLLTDPEPRPSILRLTEDANYPAATNILYSAYAIF